MFGSRRIPSESIGWKLPFNLAILFHILVLSSAIIVPKFLEKKIIIPEFLTVDLVNIAAPLTPPVAKTAAQTPVSPVKSVEPKVSKPKPKIVEAKKTAPITPVVVEEPETAPAPVKAISIKPIKRKIKKKIIPDTSAADARRARKALAREHLAAEKQRQAQERQRQQLLRQRQQLLEEARRAKVLADAEEAAAKAAVNALKQMYQADAAATSAAKVTRPSSSMAGGGSSNIIESQYQASIFSKLHEHWNVPDIKPWAPGIVSVVIIKIAKNGRIVGHRFEKKSGDRIFDQFVSRTIQEVNPLPAIPAAMRVNQYSIGLRFTPDKIQ